MPEPDPNGREAGSLRLPPVQEIAREGDVVVVRLAGELDLYNAPTVREALGDVVAEGPERLVVDLGAVEFVDSTALGVLVEARGKLANREAFLLAAPRAEPRRALEVAGLDSYFSVHETVEDALTATLGG